MPDREPSLGELRTISLALAELSRQEAETPPPSVADEHLAKLTGNAAGPAAYDLHAIWRAALADEGIEESVAQRRYLSPTRYVNIWHHMVEAREEVGTGRNRRILVDQHAAFDYAQRIDMRIMSAVIAEMMHRQDQWIADDPIGHVVHASKGGPFALMMIWYKARTAAGLSSEEFGAAVLARAKAMADELDDVAAETLFDQVRKSIDDRPVGITYVTGEDGLARVVD